LPVHLDLFGSKIYITSGLVQNIAGFIIEKQNTYLFNNSQTDLMNSLYLFGI